jgi:hypothetical protein
VYSSGYFGGEVSAFAFRAEQALLEDLGGAFCVCVAAIWENRLGFRPVTSR